jgi:hypothetical protein
MISATTTLASPNATMAVSQVNLMTVASLKMMLAVSQKNLMTALSLRPGMTIVFQKPRTTAVLALTATLTSQSQGSGKINLALILNTWKWIYPQLFPMGT